MKLNQSRFFDRKPVIYPWPKVLKEMGFSKLYKPREVKFKEYFDLLGLKRGDKVLDIGCGDGILLERLRRTYFIEAAGVDISPLSVKRAKEGNHEIKFLVANATSLPFGRNTFDAVLSFDTLEHIAVSPSKPGLAGEQKKAVREMIRVLKPKGKLLIYTINKNQKFTLNWLLDKLGIDVYIGWAHDPKLFLDPEGLKGELESGGVVIERIELFNAFFTLLADEIVMIASSVFLKLGLFEKKTKANLFMGKVFISLANFFSTNLLPVLNFLDRPLIKRGYSNSFFIMASKVNHGSR